jgi:zinc transport system ATP-binding protein
MSKKPSGPQPVIVMHDVSFAYDGDVVISRVYFKIFPGDLVSLIGPNGGGKTTLFRLILGLIRPTRGEVRVFGQSPEKGRTRVGYVPQHMSFDFKFPVSVLDVVLMGRLGRPDRPWLGPYKREDRQTALQSLSEVELEPLATRAFSDLSGGQRQRVLIARALASDPELLLLDEPTANLDRTSEQTLYELLRRLNARLTILMASHDVGFVTRFVKQCLCVNRNVILHPTSNIDGRIIRDLYGSDMSLVQHPHALEEAPGARAKEPTP